jgi:hypothetical protein
MVGENENDTSDPDRAIIVKGLLQWFHPVTCPICGLVFFNISPPELALVLVCACMYFAYAERQFTLVFPLIHIPNHCPSLK